MGAVDEWMPWKNLSITTEREQFVKAALAKNETMTELCRRFGIGRTTGYLWVARFSTGGAAGLVNRGRGRPGGVPQQRRGRWSKTVLELRRKRPSWGPKKLVCELRRRHRGGHFPSERTIGRILHEAGLTRRRKHRVRPGPRLKAPPQQAVRGCNDLWTVDFKGEFRTADGALCRPLTIRDLRSRYVLVCEHVGKPSDASVRKVMERCFRRYGLPRMIRVDNGAPFAGVGALGLSCLSVWWIRLGVRVEFTRRAKPQDNGAHEQMHRVLKEETGHPPAANLTVQGKRNAPVLSRLQWGTST
jgi:putative transposase